MAGNGRSRNKTNWGRGGAHQYASPRPKDMFGRPPGEGLTIGLIRGSWPRVHVSQMAHAKMRALIQECALEVGWLCSCSELPSGDILIEDVFVPGQICTIATTKITKDGEAQMLNELLLSGQKDVVKRLRCWGHSHVNMPVFASVPDDEQTEKFLEKSHPYFVRLIANKRNDLYCSLYIREQNLVLHNAPLILESAPAQEYAEWARKEVSEKVVEKVFTVATHTQYGNVFGRGDFTPEMIAQWRELEYIDDEVFGVLSQQLTTPEEVKV